MAAVLNLHAVRCCNRLLFWTVLAGVHRRGDRAGMDWLCREMDRLFGPDPEVSRPGSAADPDAGRVGSSWAQRAAPRTVQPGSFSSFSSRASSGTRTQPPVPDPAYGSGTPVPQADRLGYRCLSSDSHSPFARGDGAGPAGMTPEERRLHSHQKPGR